MSTQQTLTARVVALREEVERPARERAAKEAELARVEAALAAERETAARTTAERWLVGNSRALGSLASQLDDACTRLTASPSAKDIATANDLWNKMRLRWVWADVLRARFPGITTAPRAPVLPPGRRVALAELSIQAVPRPLVPVILASDPPAVAVQKRQQCAVQWLAVHGDELPDPELREALAAAPGPVTLP